jgi:hypothetical protein
MLILLSKKQLQITFVPTIMMLITIGVFGVIYELNMGTITRDVAVIGNIHPLSGFLSTLGIFLWCVAASISFFAAFIVRNFKRKKTFLFLLSSAALSTYLLFDDAFMFHENLASSYLGINEKVVLVLLGVAVFAYLFTFRNIILKTHYYVLLLALGFLGFSVLIDVITVRWLDELGYWIYFIEDGAKWIGIASWCSYYVHTSYHFVINAYAPPNK